MAIKSVQPNIENSSKSYREYKTPVKTDGLTHPLKPEGHLVDDNLLTIPKYWIKDIAYDIKAVRDGLRGTANDHQTGRLNDVGLKLGGIGIATYLASRTADPKKRLMEYLGLGAFLASISLYPKIAVNAPSRVVQGFDIGKEYIDDMGRKKSVLQDPNYIPFDMYRGEFSGEDLDAIGDNMGIPRGIKNRHDLIKEQMRKIGIQNNTLWMMTTGFATPVMTALICCGIEKLLSPAFVAMSNSTNNSRIAGILKQTEKMSSEIDSIPANKLSRKVSDLLSKYKNKELPQEEFEKLVNLITSETDNNLTQSIREDLTRLFKEGKNGFVTGEKTADDILRTINETISGENKSVLESVFGSSKQEIERAIKSSTTDGYMSHEQLKEFKQELKCIFAPKIEQQIGYSKDALYMEQNRIIENISKTIQKKQSSFVSDRDISSVVDFAKIIGDFNRKDKIIDKCSRYKIEEVNESVLAEYYAKFEKTMFDVLDIKYKDLKQMKESEQYTKEILEQKLNDLAKDNKKYEKAVNRITKIMSDMEVALNGKSAEKSDMMDLISAIENNYNNTAKRLDKLGKFSKTIDKLVKEDVSTVKNTVKSRADLFNLLDGTRTLTGAKAGLDFAIEQSKGVGSSKGLKISRIVDRYQGVSNSFRRMLHTLDVYKREIPADEYYKEINKRIKDALLTATSADHTLKLNTVNNPQLYRDIMWRGWGDPIQSATEKVIEKAEAIEKGNIKTRFQKYLKRFLDVIGNNDIDFTKPEHTITPDMKWVSKNYTPDSLTRKSKFNLVAQSPADFFRKQAEKRFVNQKWLRKAGAIGAAVLGTTMLAQFCFGHIKNPHNIVRKQVNNDTSN